MRENNVKTLDPALHGEELAELLRSGCSLPLRVTGRSMKPFLKEGRDTVILKAGEPLRRGQILFARHTDGRFILHRIRRICRDGRILLNGDAQSWCETVEPDQALAVVIGFSRNGKTVSADSLRIRIRDLLWYPTRPVRPLIFETCGFFLRLFSSRRKPEKAGRDAPHTERKESL